MTISTGGVNGTVVAAEIQELIHQLSTELSKDERQIQRDARDAEIREGMEAAHQMREKADAVKTGAIIGGVITVASAAGQFGAATEFGHVSDVEAQADGAKFGTAAGLASPVAQAFNAQGDRHEALSMEAQTRSKAAGHQGDEAETNLQAIHKVDDSGKELLQEIARNQHAGVMAILARR